MPFDNMNWLRLTPDSIGNFIALFQSAMALTYVLSLKHKSRDTRILITYLSFLTVMIFTGFLQRTGPASWQHYLFLAKICSAMLMLTALIYFAQTFLLPTEQQKPTLSFKLILSLTLIALAVLCLGQLGFGWIKAPRFFVFAMPIFLLVLTIAPCLIFFRRTLANMKSRQTNFYTKLLYPVGEQAKGLRNFGLLSILPWLIMISGMLTFYGYFALAIRDVIILILGSAYIFGFLILYLGHAKEKTSVNLKLIAVSVVAALLVLQTIASLLFTPKRLAAQTGAKTLSGHSVLFSKKNTGGYHVVHNDSQTIESPIDSSTSHEIPLNQVPNNGLIELGFDFPFYQQMWNTVYVNENGFVTFSQPYDTTRSTLYRSVPDSFDGLKNTQQ